MHPAAAFARNVALSPVLIAQALAARRRALVLPEAAGERHGVVASEVTTVATAACAAPQLRLLVAGDSSAAGVGVGHQEVALVGYLVRALVRERGGSVAWTLRARSGLTTAAVHAMLRAEPPQPSDVALVLSGVNDVVGRVSARRATAWRASLADWLLGEGLAGHVAFAPLPPMHQFPLLPDPLRRVLGEQARRHDDALAAWAAGRADVSHAAFVIELRRETMAADGFHPGEPVYRACGQALAAHLHMTLAERAPAS